MVKKNKQKREEKNEEFPWFEMFFQENDFPFKSTFIMFNIYFIISLLMKSLSKTGNWGQIMISIVIIYVLIYWILYHLNEIRNR